jgi:hypothetical protein
MPVLGRLVRKLAEVGKMLPNMTARQHTRTPSVFLQVYVDQLATLRRVGGQLWHWLRQRVDRYRRPAQPRGLEPALRGRECDSNLGDPSCARLVNELTS